MGAFGNDAYGTMELKAAALMSSLAQNPALCDGNKRMSWVLTVAFLNINGWDLTMSEDEEFNLVLGVAQGNLELEEIAAAFSRNMIVASPLRVTPVRAA